MATPTLKQLRYFEAVARHGHFGHAAETCAISQPALSMQIKELEATLGAPLFERGPRHVRLTGFGEEVLARSRDILRAVDDLQEMARAAQDEVSGRMRLGVIPTVAPYLLPALMGRLMASYPGLDLRVRETVTPRLLQEMEAGALDAAIVALPISEPALAEVPLFTEEFVLVRPAAEAGAPVPRAETLREMRLLLLEEGHCFRDQALSFCAAPAARPRELLDGSSLSTLVQMVGAGMGVTLIPEMAVPVETRSADVSIAHFQTPRPQRTIGMIWRKTSPLACRFQRIADTVRDTAQALNLTTAENTAA
ncbi:LysR substrate-binding domain-containing protein [Rhodovulum adriaticum]|uniref:LysR family transcriptional regulator n=1 Tax=Rhodovulum adriaticum TaxID=35804 RepID=A0A4R2NM02_RHOAD|nr:LysR substrate-binding domain-containing protein [Rhodovulum adriaticum]MBK1635140.1 LysR family transcriptional regulator [Rhodovulum adriaticum]TCP22254.1 LysR family transcriptional regulator [Rhodovulum adriaticum]